MGMADKVVLYSYLCFFRGFGEVGAAKPDVVRLSEGASAAFRRLCVETCSLGRHQPPSLQPPSGGCVLKPAATTGHLQEHESSAAFRRLCVETSSPDCSKSAALSAAFRRLCVETWSLVWERSPQSSAAFRRLCVETLLPAPAPIIAYISRLQAAVC